MGHSIVLFTLAKKMNVQVVALLHYSDNSRAVFKRREVSIASSDNSWKMRPKHLGNLCLYNAYSPFAYITHIT